jgi:hypothetical protein
MTEKSTALLVSALSGMIVVVAAIISNSGLRPYDEQEIDAQIDVRTALCAPNSDLTLRRRYSRAACWTSPI